jgi:hypothetical protein
VAGHALEKVQLDTGVGHPGQRRVSQAVPDDAGQPKIINQFVPPRRIVQGRGRVHPSTRTNQQASIPGPTTVSRSSVAHSSSMIGTGHRRRPLVSLVTRPPPRGYVCLRTANSPRMRSTSPTCSPATSLIRNAVVAKIITQSPRAR